MYSEFLEKLRKERELAKEKALENINDILDKLKKLKFNFGEEEIVEK